MGDRGTRGQDTASDRRSVALQWLDLVMLATISNRSPRGCWLPATPQKEDSDRDRQALAASVNAMFGAGQLRGAVAAEMCAPGYCNWKQAKDG